jgi:predicted metal-dependent hydrolase
MKQFTLGDITIDVVRKSIKNLHLGVYPPDGRVRVASPIKLSDESIRLYVATKLPWIRKQQAQFAAQERQPEREYVRRESHYVWGQRYLLNVIEQGGAHRVELRSKTYLDMYVRPGTCETARKQLLNDWYREQLKAHIPDLIAKWEPVMDVTVDDWGVKQMKTKWGTCTIEARRIWLNLELAKKPLHCLEYIVVHEMTHLLERHHNDRFRALLTQYLPTWQRTRDELNTLMLSAYE